MSIVGRGIYLGGGDGGATLNIDYGATPPVDTSKLWVPLEEKPVKVEINGEKISYGQHSLEPWKDGDPTTAGETQWITDFAARVGDYIYVFGRPNSETNTCICRFNPADGTFEVRLSATGGHLNHNAACVVGAYIYFVYAADDSTLLRYDTEANTVETWMPIPTTTFSTLIWCGGYIYMFYSYSSSSSGSTTSYKIDVVNKTYAKITSFPKAHSSSPWAWVYDGKIWLFAMPSSSDAYYLYSYDTETDTYTLEKSGRQALFGLNSVDYELYSSYRLYGAESPVPVIGSSVYFLQYLAASDYYNSTPYVLDMETLMFTVAPSVVDTGYYAVRYSGFALYDMSMYMFGGTLYTVSTTSSSGYEHTLKIRRYRVETDLPKNHLKIITDMTKRQTALINEDNCQLYAAVNGAYIGNADNYAREVDAYLYDTTDSQWKTLGGVAYTE